MHTQPGFCVLGMKIQVPSVWVLDFRIIFIASLSMELSSEVSTLFPGMLAKLRFAGFYAFQVLVKPCDFGQFLWTSVFVLVFIVVFLK